MTRFSLLVCWKYLLFLGLMIGSLLLLVGCGPNMSAGPTSTLTNGVSTSTCGIEVSWARGYGSLKELKHSNELDLAVQGKFTAISGTNNSDNPLSTDFTFTISKMLLNPHQLPQDVNSTLTIHQTGGLRNGQLCQVSDDPLFHVGEEAILFLNQYSPGHYRVIGGPSGRFVVRNGLVQPINDEGVKLPPATTVEQFYSMWQQA